MPPPPKRHMFARAVPIAAYAAIIVACTTQSNAGTFVPEPPQPVNDTKVAADPPKQPTPPTIPVAALPKAPCPGGMVEVDGEYCPNVEEVCLRWVGIHGQTIEPPGGKFPTGRCGEFKFPTRCLSKQTVHKHFCIDEYEYPNVEGQVPQSWMDWYDVKNACEAEGKRLCTKSEWTFSCEGPDIQPYPYGDGYHRDTTACNFDNMLPPGPNDTKLSVFNATSPKTATAQILESLLVPSGAMARCVSPFGVHDQVGNLDEFVNNTPLHEHQKSAPYVSGLVGGHVFGVRNNCRAMTDGHNEWFGWYETGGRCCSDPQEK